MQSIIRAFRNILGNYSFDKGESFPEQFAIQRYYKKMEIPNDSHSKSRKEACLSTWLDCDEKLALPRLLPSNWYKARLLLHSMLEDFHLSNITFSNGSEVTATRGFNSIESKLSRSQWDCTPDCFNDWSALAFRSLAIRRAVRARFSAVMFHNRVEIKRFHKDNWIRFRGNKFLCFQKTLSYVTMICDHSRFSTVRKNNEKDRPIDIQPLCNMLVQRTIGEGFRSVLKRNGIDLDSLAQLHGRLISNNSLATIDLSNASDSISLSLVKFLLPSRIFNLILRSRTFYTMLPNGDFYITKKVSSMGNGFTFELMTLILYALGLSYEDSFSVFGDDIIISNTNAPKIISDLEAVGFTVNKEKSFVNSNFRESCGYNYHDDFGYIQSFDFRYPDTIHDCIMAFNKCFLLKKVYPQFEILYVKLKRAVPIALQGPPDVSISGSGRQGLPKDVQFPSYFWCDNLKCERIDDTQVQRRLKEIHLLPVGRYFYGYKWSPKTASGMRNNLISRLHYGKYFMYLHGCRRVDDVITGKGSWQKVSFLQCDGRAFRLKSLCT